MRMRSVAMFFVFAAGVSVLWSPAAHASDEDDVFWQTLDNYGYTQKAISTWGSERKAITAGKQACDMMEDGYRYNEVNMVMIQDNPGKDMGTIGYTIFSGMTAYCPSYGS